MGSDGVPMGSDVVRLGPMGSDWVISHTPLLLLFCHSNITSKLDRHKVVDRFAKASLRRMVLTDALFG